MRRAGGDPARARRGRYIQLRGRPMKYFRSIRKWYRVWRYGLGAAYEMESRGYVRDRRRDVRGCTQGSTVISLPPNPTAEQEEVFTIYSGVAPGPPIF